MARTVVTKTKKSKAREAREFNFSREMLPVNNGVPESLKDYRDQAWTAYESTAMPTTSDEPWRRTDIRKLQAGRFRLPSVGEFEEYSSIPEELLEPLGDDHLAGQIILRPGGSQTHIKSDLEEMGVIFTDLSGAQRNYPDVLVDRIGQVVKADEGKFAALAAAYAENGVFLYVPKGVQVDQPLHSILWGPGAGLALFSHIIVWLDEGASLTYIHESASETDSAGQTMHAGLVEIHLEDRANLRFVELQSWGEHVWNFSHKRAQVGKNANIDWVFAAIGSHLTKDFSDINLVGEGAEGRMSGFYFTDGNQHLDHDTQQNHMAPNTSSDLLFKGVLKEESRSVWQGMIYVAPGAQKTDGYQANRNLVLSKNARADSIPGLEIMADDVRCTHGATVGKIDLEELFYLRSRGIELNDAQRLIVEGFFDPIMQRIPFKGVQNRLHRIIAQKMG